MRHVRLFLAVMALLGSAGLAAAQLDSPGGQPVLLVTGAIAETNAADAARFDLEMLRALDWVEIETHTSFTEGVQRFAGPTLSSLLSAVGASGQVLRATALNGYYVEIPVADAAAHGVILAVEHNGELMRVRDKGPIWVVYPATEDEARRKLFDSEMIWQLQSLHVDP